MRKYFNKKGQSTLEYAVIIAVIVAGLIAMQAYIKRGVQGRLKQSTDDIGEQFSSQSTSSNYTVTSNTVSNEKLANGTTTTNITTGQQSRTGSESTGNFQNEYWK